jgi:hypothetical protein
VCAVPHGAGATTVHLMRSCWRATSRSRRFKGVAEREHETRKASITAVLAGGNLQPKSLLGSTLADHLQAGDAQLTSSSFHAAFPTWPSFFSSAFASRVGEPVTVTWWPTWSASLTVLLRRVPALAVLRRRRSPGRFRSRGTTLAINSPSRTCARW